VPGHDGRWLTYDWRAGVATLWEPYHVTQEAEPALFDVPWKGQTTRPARLAASPGLVTPELSDSAPGLLTGLYQEQ
jgi:hypothetical protein